MKHEKKSKPYSMTLLSLFFGALFVLLTGISQANQTKPWGIINNVDQRFVVLSSFNDEAVLDRETGLIWERSPSTELESWENQIRRCMGLEIANRLGWRLPTHQELGTLIDTSQSPIKLPAGHPFQNVQPDQYYTATPNVGNVKGVITLNLTSVNNVTIVSETSDRLRWCVRGGTQDISHFPFN